MDKMSRRKDRKGSPLKKFKEFDAQVQQFQQREYRKRSMMTPLFEEEMSSIMDQKSIASKQRANDFNGSFSVSFPGLSEIKFEGGGDGDEKDNDRELVNKTLGSKAKDSPPRRDYGDRFNADNLNNQIKAQMKKKISRQNTMTGDEEQNIRDALRLMGQAQARREKVLRCCNLQLEDIVVEKMEDYPWFRLNLEEIDISMNQLTNIDFLDDYSKLKIINASDNQIDIVFLSLSQLETLDLKMNQIQKFPQLANCKNLHTLDLEQNFISKISDVNCHDTPNLADLSLKSNQIQFQNDQEMIEFFEKISLWSNLKALNIDDNPFQENERRGAFSVLVIEKASKILPQLLYYNGMNRGQQLVAIKMIKDAQRLEQSAGVSQRLNQSRISKAQSRASKVPSKKQSTLNVNSPSDSHRQNVSQRDFANAKPAKQQFADQEISDFESIVPSYLQEAEDEANEGERLEPLDQPEALQLEQPVEQLPLEIPVMEEQQPDPLQSPGLLSPGPKEDSLRFRPMPNKKKKNKFAPPPSIIDLISHLEIANAQPQMAHVVLQNLSGSCNEIIEKEKEDKEQFEKDFAPKPGEIKELIEVFMQNCQLLIDNSKEHMEQMCIILARLSVVKFADFGEYCFNTLVDCSKASNDLEQMVENILQSEVIPAIKEQSEDVKRLSEKLLQGLLEYVNETENTDMLADLYLACFPSWLSKYCKMMADKKKNKQKMLDDPHYDAVIGLVSKSLDENKDNVELCQEKLCDTYIAKIMNDSTAVNARYIPVLQAVARLANQDSEIADDFISKYQCHKALIKQINGSMKIYFKNDQFSLFAEDSTELFSVRKSKYTALATEIVSLGGLLQAKEQESRMQILQDPSEVTLQIISIMNHERTDPILLTAICTFALDLFECDDLRQNGDFMKPWSDRMNNLKEMIPYLGGEKYQDLLVMTRQYQKGDQVGSKMTESGAFELTQITHKPPEQDDKSIDEEEAAEQLENLIQDSLKKLDDQLVSDLFISVIKLIIYFCTEAENKDENMNHRFGNQIFDGISEYLNDNGREEALFKSLAIPNDDVKLAVVKCLFVVPLDELDIEEISQIVKIVEDCNDISSGKTELVLSTVYWIKFKLAHEQVELNGPGRVFQENFGEMSINYALSFLVQNSARISDNEDDDKEKFTLSMSILNFLKCSSHAPMMQEHMKDQDQIFKQILMQEDVNSSPTIKEVPIDIENTMMGRSIQCLIDCISGNDSIEPYSDVSLRIFMRMADILMFRHTCYYCDIETTNNPARKLYKKQIQIYKKKKDQEKNFWVDCPLAFYDNVLKSEIDRKELRLQHYNFTQSNGVSLLKMFLSTKYPINEEYIQKICDPCFTDSTQKSLADLITDKRAKLEFTFKNQYVGQGKRDEYALRQTMMEKELKNQRKPEDEEVKGSQEKEQEGAVQKSNQKSQDMTKEEKIQEYQRNRFHRTQDAKIYSYQQKIQQQELGEELIKVQGGGGAQPKQSKADIETQLRDKVREEQNAILADPESTETLSQKEIRGDGFLNQDLRNLTVAAFLRCLFAAIEYAPDYEIKQTAIDNLSDIAIFRSITQLCDSTDWNEQCHIGAKYLRVMRYVIKIPIDRNVEKMDKLVHYEIMAMVIQKCLGKIIDKMDKGMELTDGDVVSNYEISLTLFTVLQQTNNYVFSEFDLYKQYLNSEAKIAHELLKKKDKNTEEKLKKWPELIKQSENGPWQKKCEHIMPTHGKKKLTKYNYTVQLNKITVKRTIQAKMVETMVMTLFSIPTINSLLNILFNDMQGDYKDLLGEFVESDDDQMDPTEAEEEEDEEVMGSGEGSGGGEDDEEEESEEDVMTDYENYDETRNGVDIDEYISLKGTLTIERIKDIVGQLMSSCEGKLKYEILQSLMKGVIFDGKPLRESFLQEILNAQNDATYMVALEKYMNEQSMTCMQFFKDKDPKFIEMLNPNNDPKFKADKIHERVLELCDTEVNNFEIEHIMLAPKDEKNPAHHTKEPDIKFYDRVLVLTTYGIQILKKLPDNIVCLNCPTHFFCPRGPIQEWCIKYSSIETIINFPQQPQKLVIIYNNKIFDDKDQLVELIRFQITLKIQTFTKCSKVYSTLMQAMAKIGLMKAKQSKKVEGIQEKIQNTFKIDRFVGFELQHFIHQIEGLKDVSKKKIQDLNFIYCEYAETNVISEEFFEEHVQDHPDPKAQQSQDNKQMNGGRPKPYVPSIWDEESELNIVNNVLVCVIKGHIVIFKEKWENWQFMNIDQLRQYKLKMRSDYNNNKGLWDFSAQGGKEMIKADMDLQKKMEITSKYCLTSLFQLVTLIKIDKNTMQKAIVHSGQNATVEIVVDDDHWIVLDFTGDMERQNFCSQIIDCLDGNDEDDDEGEGDEMEDDDSDEDNKKENSDTEELKVEVYD